MRLAIKQHLLGTAVCGHSRGLRDARKLQSAMRIDSGSGMSAVGSATDTSAAPSTASTTAAGPQIGAWPTGGADTAAARVVNGAGVVGSFAVSRGTGLDDGVGPFLCLDIDRFSGLPWSTLRNGGNSTLFGCRALRVPRRRRSLARMRNTRSIHGP